MSEQVAEAAAFLKVDPDTLQDLAPDVLALIVDKARAETQPNHDPSPSSPVGPAAPQPETVENVQSTGFYPAQSRSSPHPANSEGVATSATTRLNELMRETAAQEQELTALRQQLSLANQDKSAIVDSLDRRNTENRDLRKEIDRHIDERTELRAKLHKQDADLVALSTDIGGAKMRETVLKLDLERSEKDNKWLHNELKRVNETLATLRTKYRTETSELQASLEELETSNRGLGRNHSTLKTTYNQLSRKHDQALSQIETLKRKNAESESTFVYEMSTQKKLTEIAEAESKFYEDSTKSLEQDLASTREELSSRVEDLTKLYEDEQKRNARLQEEVSSAEEKLSGLLLDPEGYLAPQMPGPVSSLAESTPMSAANSTQKSFLYDGTRSTIRGQSNASGLGVLSPSAKIIAELHRKGGTVTDLFNSYNATKNDAELYKHNYEALRRQMDQILHDLELREPDIRADLEELDRLRREVSSLTSTSSSQSRELQEAERQKKVLESKVKDLRVENDIAGQEIRDLSRQLQFLLINAQLTVDGEPAMSGREKEFMNRVLSETADQEGDTDQLISQRLTLFKDVAGLQEQNIQLLAAIRSMGKRLERQDSQTNAQAPSQQNGDLSADALGEAMRLSETLQNQIVAMSAQVEDLKNERDALRNGSADATTLLPLKSTADLEALSYRTAYQEAKETYEAHKVEHAATVHAKDQRIGELEAIKRDLDSQLSRLNAQLELQIERKSMLEEQLSLRKSENETTVSELQASKAALSSETNRTSLLRQELADAQSNIERFRQELARMTAEKALWRTQEDRLVKAGAEASEEARSLRLQIDTMSNAGRSSEDNRAAAEKLLVSQIDLLQSQITVSAHKHSTLEDELKQVYHRRELELSAQESKVTSLLETITSLKSDLVAAQNARMDSEKKLTETTARMEAAEARVRIRLEAENATAKNGQESLEKELELTRDELRLAQERAAEVSAALQQARADLESNKSAAQIQAKALQEQLAQESASLQAMTNNHEQVLANYKTLQSEFAALDAPRLLQSIDTLRGELESSHARSVELTASTEQATAQSKQLENALQAERQKHAETSEAVNAIKSQVSSLTLELAEARKAAESATTDLEEQRQSVQAQIEQQQARINELTEGNTQLLDQIQRSMRGTEEMNTGANSGASLDEGTSDATAIVSYLRREKDMVEMRLQTALHETQSLNVQLQLASQDLNNSRKEVQELRAEVQQAQESLSRISVLTSEKDALTAANSDLQSELNERSSALSTYATQLADVRRSLDEAKLNLRNALKDTEVRAQQIALLEKELALARDNAKKAGSGVVDSDVVAKLQTNFDTAQRELQAKSQELVSLRTRASQRIQEMNGSIERYKKQVEELTTKLQAVEVEASNAAAATETPQDSNASSTANNVTNVDGNAGGTAELAALQAEIARLTAEIAGKNERIDYLENEVNRVSDELVEVQVASKAASEANLVASDAAREIAGLKVQVTSLQKVKSEAESLSQELGRARAEISRLESAASQPGADSAELFAAKERIKALESQVEDAKARVDLGAGDDNKDLQALRQQLLAKLSEKEVDDAFNKVRVATQERVKDLSYEAARKRVQQDSQEAHQAALKAMEQRLEKKFEIKSKLLRTKVDGLEQANKDLSTTVRKLKGGVDNVAITTLPSGVTKVAPDSNETPRISGSRPTINRQARPGIKRGGTEAANFNQKRRKDD